MQDLKMLHFQNNIVKGDRKAEIWENRIQEGFNGGQCGRSEEKKKRVPRWQKS